MRQIAKIQFFDMSIAVTQSAAIASIFLLLIATAAASLLAALPLLDALIAGILVTIFHWFSQFMHMYGHFLAAKRVGYPSTGTRIWSIIGTILYPEQEEGITPDMHIQRALGGPLMSLFVGIVAIIIALLLWNLSEILRFVLLWWVIENIFVFAFGALFPPYFYPFENDGGTVLHWLRIKRGQAAAR